MSITVLDGGLLTTVQDHGRTGFRHLGVGCAGVADAYSAAVANLLVGNQADMALLESTLRGPRLRFERGATVALCGADMAAQAGTETLLPWRRIALPAGTILSLHASRLGARGYLAIDGGIAVRSILGSRSTDLRAGFGGQLGRALQCGDQLPLGEPGAAVRDRVTQASAWFDPTPDLTFARDVVLRLLPGNDRDGFAALLEASAWQVGPSGNRQGVRLLGNALPGTFAGDARSEPVLPGTVQVPPDGMPIVLLCDAQTMGGYARLAHVIEADLPRLAQCRPGDRIRFVAATPEQALRLRQEQAQRLARLAVVMHASAQR